MNTSMPCQLGGSRALVRTVCSLLLTQNLKACVVWTLLMSTVSSLSRLMTTTIAVLLFIGSIALEMGEMRPLACRWFAPVLLGWPAQHCCYSHRCNFSCSTSHSSSTIEISCLQTSHLTICMIPFISFMSIDLQTIMHLKLCRSWHQNHVLKLLFELCVLI